MFSPFNEELQNLVLALLREPGLVRDKELDLVQIGAEDLGSKGGDEVLGKGAVGCFKSAGELGGVAVSVEGEDGEIR